MVFGFDIDGTLTVAAEQFRAIMGALVKDGHECHVLTGTRDYDITDQHYADRHKQLVALGIGPSLYQQLVIFGGGPDVVATAKAKYCKDAGVRFMFEDSPSYTARIRAVCPCALMVR